MGCISPLCLWNFPGKNTGVGCHFLLQGILPILGSNLYLLHFLHWQVSALPLYCLGSLKCFNIISLISSGLLSKLWYNVRANGSGLLKGHVILLKSLCFGTVALGAMLCLVTQLCPTLWDPMDCSPPGSSVHGNSPGRNTGVGCMTSFRGSPQPRDQTQVSHIAGGFFTIWANGEAPYRSSKSRFFNAVYLHMCIAPCIKASHILRFLIWPQSPSSLLFCQLWALVLHSDSCLWCLQTCWS